MATSKIKIPSIGLLNNLLHLPKIIRNPASYFKNHLDNNNGLVEMHLPFGKIYLTDRPELIKYVLQQNHRNYTKTAIVRTILREQIGNGLLTSEGDYWLKQRRAIQPGFHRNKLAAIAEVMVEEINKYMDEVLDDLAKTGEEFDLMKEMTHLAFRIVSKCLFGEIVDDAKLKRIDKIVSELQQFVIDQVRKPFARPWFYISGVYERKKALKEEGDQLILEIIKARQQSGKKQDDLLDMLLETKYEDGSKMTNQQLLDEAIVLYVAGHETSAIALSWAWYLLATHPEIEEHFLIKIQKEIGSQVLSFEQLNKLSYSLQIIEETMRLYPPAWIIDREPLSDDEFNGIQIEKSHDVVCLVYGVHRNPKYWKDPEKFDPERFSLENKKKHVPYSYIPFGGGPRLCIGNNFALMEMQFVLTMLHRRYQFELLPGHKIEINPLITLRPRYGIKARVKKRAEL